MARTIYFRDGSHEVLFFGEYDTAKKAAALERILYERLGIDAAGLFHEFMQDCRDEVSFIEEELRKANTCTDHIVSIKDAESAAEWLNSYFTQDFTNNN